MLATCERHFEDFKTDETLLHENERDTQVENEREDCSCSDGYSIGCGRDSVHRRIEACVSRRPEIWESYRRIGCLYK